MSTERMKLADDFRGDNAKLIGCIEALISLSDDGALVPHGIGGHARGLLSAAAVRLAALPAPEADAGAVACREAVARIIDPDIYSVYDIHKRAGTIAENGRPWCDVVCGKEIAIALGKADAILALRASPSGAEAGMRERAAASGDVVMEQIVQIVAEAMDDKADSATHGYQGANDLDEERAQAAAVGILAALSPDAAPPRS